MHGSITLSDATSYDKYNFSFSSGCGWPGNCKIVKMSWGYKFRGRGGVGGRGQNGPVEGGLPIEAYHNAQDCDGTQL